MLSSAPCCEAGMFSGLGRVNACFTCILFNLQGNYQNVITSQGECIFTKRKQKQKS